jgi:allantoin racemase
MKILIINPNTDDEVTQAVKRQASKYKNNETIIDAVSSEYGPDMIEDWYGDWLAGIGVLKEVKKAVQKGGYDGIAIAAGCDTALDAAREVTDVPVMAFLESGLLMAHMLGKRFAVLFPSRKWVFFIDDLINKYGLQNRCVGIKLLKFPPGLKTVAEFEKNKELVKAALAEAGKAAIEDGAEVLCLGGTHAVGLDEMLEKELGIPVIDGVVAAVKFLEALYG